MKLRQLLPIALLGFSSVAAHAASTSELIVGGALGGAAGAVIGDAVGGRDGAVIGGALGAGVGVAAVNKRSKSAYYPHYHGHKHKKKYRKWRHYDDD
ncbi:glycine zipper domain-containing protein [Crenobacter intestini]|uniref:Glycine zipper domain-containing protein n=1 Tax=Crenobacter intestini TaxID=2563443 RepID=A0A4T0UR80_9NEIS|nr:glycine zipper domain-containing protein [Crenobacter intestini]TIC81389.1 hypothetical protein E5K04_10745 [Crenobacter intestini]